MTRWYPQLVYAPRRWRTHDGVIPYRVLLAYASGLEAVKAGDRLSMAQAIGLALGGEQAGDMAQRELEAAYP